MGFNYHKLWEKLRANGMKKNDLQKAISTTPATIARLSKEEYVSMDILGRICEYFYCDIGDILQYLPDELEDKYYELKRKR